MQNLKRCGKNPAHQALAKEVSSSIVLCISWTAALFGAEAMQGQEASSSPPLPISPAISATPLSFQTRGFQSFGYDSPGSVSYTGNVYDDFAQQLSQNIPYIPAQHGPTGDYNFKVGGLTGSLFSTLNFGYTDNIFLAEKKAESDFSIQPGFGLGLQLEVSRQSRLRLDIGLGYNFYVNHSELNYLSASILPNSVLDYRFVVGDVMIVVFDRFSAPNDARLRPEIGTGSSGLVNYQRINNAMGNTVSWAINRDLVLSGGYTFLIDRGLNSNYSQLDRNTHLFNASAQQRVNELWSVGAFGTYAITDYSKSIQNDATSWALGPMFALRPSRYIEIAASVGFTSTTFDLAKNPFSVRDTASFEGLTFEAAIRHQINRSMNHSLTASRSAELGLGSNFSEYTSVTYSLSWEIIQRMALSGGFSYLNFKQSGVALTGYTPESGGLFRFFVGASYPLAKRLNATFNFAHHLKDSNLLGRDYSQNYVSIGLMYRF